jgi:hypothetical protein
MSTSPSSPPISGCPRVPLEDPASLANPRLFALQIQDNVMVGKHIISGDVLIFEHGIEPRQGTLWRRTNGVLPWLKRRAAIDFSEVKGRQDAKRAIEVAVAGGRHLLMLWSMSGQFSSGHYSLMSGRG